MGLGEVIVGSSFASSRVTSATIATASLSARTPGWTTALTHLIHGGRDSFFGVNDGAPASTDDTSPAARSRRRPSRRWRRTDRAPAEGVVAARQHARAARADDDQARRPGDDGRGKIANPFVLEDAVRVWRLVRLFEGRNHPAERRRRAAVSSTLDG